MRLSGKTLSNSEEIVSVRVFLTIVK